MTQAAAIAPETGSRGTVNPLARLSLRTRVAINVVTVTALIQLVLGAVTFLYFRSTIDQFFNFRLVTRVRLAASEISSSTTPLDPQFLGTVSDRTLRMLMFNSLVLVVRDDNGRVIARSEDRTDISELVPPEHSRDGYQLAMVHVPHIGTGEEDRVPARTITVPVTLQDGRRVFVTGAVSNASAAETVSVIGRAVLIVSLFGLVATGTAAWFVTGFSLKPLSSLRHVAEQFNLETIAEPQTEQPAQPVPELAQITAELQAARERISQAVQSNERFISNVSHELKTPIAVLRAQAQTLDSTEIPPKTREFVRSVIEETRRLGTMVDSFLTLASVRSGRSLNSMRPVYLNDVMLETVAHCAMAARQGNVTIVPELHDADEDLVIAGDPDLLRVLFDNLLRNAVRFSPPGSSVVAAVSCTYTAVTVSITDAGPGIPSEILPRLFERFTQASQEVGRGHGLGLSIAQGIAELHGGLITVTNLPDGGCRFALSLPRITAHSSSDRPPSPPPPPPPTPPTPPGDSGVPARQPAHEQRTEHRDGPASADAHLSVRSASAAT